MARERISISAVFPAYNDAATIEAIVRKAVRVLKDVSSSYEIIVVNDSSADDTGKICGLLTGEFKELRVIHHEKNLGYGRALRSGFANATKEWIFYTDSDGQYDVFELEKLVEHADEADVVNGYKIKRADSLNRKVLGRVYHYLTKLFFGIPLKDVDCDFRLMKNEIFKAINLESDGGVVCVEMMKRIATGGWRIFEVPVHHFPRVSGKSQFFRPKNVIRLGTGLLGLWWKLVFLECFQLKPH